MRVDIACLCLVLCQVCTLSLSQSTIASSAQKTTKTMSTTTPTSQSSVKSDKTTSTGPSSTTESPLEECSTHNKSCDECIKNVKCFYCYGEVDTCKPYPKGNWVPWKLPCPLANARWAVCWLNFEAMLIAVGVIGGSIVLAITCCCVYCCCCRGRNKAKYIKDEIKMEREKTERKQRSSDKRADRQERLNEIRRKYGLVKDEPSYERFDA